MNFDWIVEGKVAAMALPWPEDVPELKRRGVTAVLSLSERQPPEFAGAGFRVLSLPIRDFHPPTVEQCDAAAEFIDKALAEGGAVAVHCGAGLGRTGTILAAWLVRQGRSAPDAIAEVRRRRPGSVETREQEDAVAAYERARMGKKR